MKKSLITVVAMAAFFSLSHKAEAQSWLDDLLNNDTAKDVVNALTGNETPNNIDVTGRWKYVKPALKLIGDNFVENIAGDLASEQLASKLEELCGKAGIKAGLFSYTFGADSTFTSDLKLTKMKGKYSIAAERESMTLSYSLIGSAASKLLSMEATVVKSGNSLCLLFNADKLMEFLTTISSKIDNKTIQAVTAIAEQYESLKIGFELEKEQ